MCLAVHCSGSSCGALKACGISNSRTYLKTPIHGSELRDPCTLDRLQMLSGTGVYRSPQFEGSQDEIIVLSHALEPGVAGSQIWKCQARWPWSWSARLGTCESALSQAEDVGPMLDL